ncbi:RNI-like protein [Hyaloscypha hepaticicola]|uniref:RNI-like protein n=1 Tax=Hyaloscypha hepaticicola TaxID=2082293 RepID=A0A2J6PFK3_9HELO|nr:RNI-like protein [Hyaloscypha hepaticicola]
MPRFGSINSRFSGTIFGALSPEGRTSYQHYSPHYPRHPRQTHPCQRVILISPNPPNTSQIRSTGSQTILKMTEDASTSIDHLLTTDYTMEDQISTLHSIEHGDFSNEEGIQALPRRRPKSQRPLAMQLASIMYPEDTDIAAIIKYERLISLAKSIVRNKQKTRLAPKSQARMLHIQGPWAGQVFDPVDLKGPDAIPMPVEIGKTEDFAPIFEFLAHESFEDASRNGFRPNLDFLRKNEEFTGNVPLLEFRRGIIYEDGRLDLCKKVVGPTHIGTLMESLESNEQIRHFLLGNNVISTTGAKKIAEFIQKYPDHMETWYLAGYHLTCHGLSLLVPRMITSSTITNLWFKRNPFGPEAAPVLANLVLLTRNLRTLDLETTQLGDEGTRQCIDAITGYPSPLRNLYLNANSIGEGAYESLGKYLGDPNCKLESLFLSINLIGDTGMLLLAPGLVKNKTLKRFMCASSSLTGKDLGASQTTKAHVQKFNYFDNTSVEALKALIMIPSLRWLNVGGTVISNSGVEEIRVAIGRSELDSAPVVKSCPLALRKQLAKNQAKHFP